MPMLIEDLRKQATYPYLHTYIIQSWDSSLSPFSILTAIQKRNLERKERKRQKERKKKKEWSIINENKKNEFKNTKNKNIQ